MQSASTVSEAIDLAVPAGLAWQLVGDFGGVAAWIPGVTAVECEGRGCGAVRRFTVGGHPVAERQEERDESQRRYVYALLEGPLPVRDYRAEIRVELASAGRSRVVWTAVYTPTGMSPDECEQLLRKAYRRSLDHLRRLAEGDSDLNGEGRTWN